MITIALGQMKGGCGRDCTAINLACEAAHNGLKTALLDMDIEQGTTWKWGDKRGIGKPHVEKVEAAKLKAKLESLAADGYDYVFIDLPGRSAPSASAGLNAADLIIVPCRPVDTDIEPSLTTVKSAVRSNKKYAYLMNIAPHQGDKKRAKQVAEVLRAAGHPVSPVIVVQRLEVPDAIAAGKSVREYKPGNDAVKEFDDLLAWVRSQTK